MASLFQVILRSQPESLSAAAAAIHRRGTVHRAFFRPKNEAGLTKLLAMRRLNTDLSG